MSARMRVTDEQVASAYQQTGSVWKAGKLLGIGGQSVHERLVRLGIKLSGGRWTEEELVELRHLVDHCTLSEIASRLGRSYAGVACKVSELGVGHGTTGRVKRKIPRGVGYDKTSVARYIKEIDAADVPVTRYARSHGLDIEMLAQVIERTNPQWWRAYRAAHSDLPEQTCPYCGGLFIPATGKQAYCTRRCASLQRTDQSYFGGKRRQTVGLAEGKCQLCGRTPSKALSSHHIFGKENDPENNALVALCSGCHQIVTILGARDWTNEQWEGLISLAWIRRNGPTASNVEQLHTLHVCVDLDLYQEEDDAS